MNLRITLGLLLCFCFGSYVEAPRAGEEPPAFAARPTVSKVGEKTIIAFAANRETDAVVYILDAQGKIVRRLAAGVLNKNAPEPFKPGLSQSLEWDGKDDFGKAAAGGPFKVRVALGMKPQFDRFVLQNPDGLGRVHALAVGPAGTVYVFHAENTANDTMGGHKIKVFTREGRHLKVLMPFPADIAPEKVKALGVFRTDEGDLIPRVHNCATLSFYPDTIGSGYREMPEVASSPAVDSKGRLYWMVSGAILCALDADGGVPYESFLGPKLLPEIKGLRIAGEPYEIVSERPTLAVSSDDQFVYFAGLSAGSGAVPCVFRVPVDKRGPAEVFVGKLGQPGKEKDLLTAPRGLAVAKGLLYVADPAADRIAVFKEADRTYIGEIKIKYPQCIGMDPATGAVYVCAYDGKQAPELIKVSGWENAKELYKMALPGSPMPGQHRIGVDASAKPVRIWMPEIYPSWSLKCIEDAGDKFVDKGDPRRTDPWIEGPRDMSVERVRGELYIKGNYGKMDGRKHWRFDDKTCEALKDVDYKTAAAASGTQLVPGTDGSLYTLSFGSGLMRYDHDFKPLNFEGQNSNHIPIGGTMNFQERHLALRPCAPVDELFVVAPPFYRQVLEEKMTWDDAAKKAAEHLRGRYTTLNVLGQDGKSKRTVIWQCLDSAIPRLDAKGNIYLVDSVKPMDRSYPAFFDGKILEPGKGPAGSDVTWNNIMYASIVKFPPSGGAIWHKKGALALSCLGKPPEELLAKPKVPFRTIYDSGYGGEPDGVQGALWIRFGYSPYSTPGSGPFCNCEGSGFDVDPTGRIFFPNLGQSRVEVVDTNNNFITAFGKYGNEDSGGKDATVKKPEIPLAWPTYVAVSDDFVYVSDTVNRRVVRVKLVYAADETCVVK